MHHNLRPAAAEALHGPVVCPIDSTDVFFFYNRTAIISRKTSMTTADMSVGTSKDLVEIERDRESYDGGATNRFDNNNCCSSSDDESYYSSRYSVADVDVIGPSNGGVSDRDGRPSPNLLSVASDSETDVAVSKLPDTTNNEVRIIRVCAIRRKLLELVSPVFIIMCICSITMFFLL